MTPLNWNNTPYNTFKPTDPQFERELKNAEKLGTILSDLKNLEKIVDSQGKNNKEQVEEVRQLISKSAEDIKELVSDLQNHVNEVDKKVDDISSQFKVIVAKAGVYFSIFCSALAYGVNFLIDKFKG